MTAKIGRAERRRMTADELRAAMDRLDLSPDDFAWLVASDPRRVSRWLAGDDTEIPPHIAMMVHVFLTVPGATDAAISFTRMSLRPVERPSV